MGYDAAFKRLQERLTNPGVVEGSDEDDQLLDLINGSMKLMPTGLTINPLIKKEIGSKNEVILEKLTTSFKDSLLVGRVALERGTTDDIVPAFGPVGHPLSIPVQKKATYIKLKKYWWGFRLYLSHACVDDLVKAGAGAVSILAACGVAAWIAALVVAVVGAIKGFDKGSGVTLSFTWVGILIWIRSGKHL